MSATPRHPKTGKLTPAPRPANHPSRLASWRTWFAEQQQVSARELATRMEEKARTVQAYAAGSRNPTENALLNLESLSAAYGYQPPTADHLLL